MLNPKGFDLWADGYDRDVAASDEEDRYPFAGYRKVLEGICAAVLEKPGAAVLDLGFGTGELTARLYEGGCRIWGQDFSGKMIERAQAKMPDAHLVRGDFSEGPAEALLARRYDFIISTYALHHLTDDRKISLLRTLRGLLEEEGKILIGDVAFRDRAQLEACRREAGDEWDGEEYYFVADELRDIFPEMAFTQVSYCSGILTLEGKNDGTEE